MVTRRTVFLLRTRAQRGHILEGQAVALANIDPVVELIKPSPDCRGSAGSADGRKAGRRRTCIELLARAGSDACRPDGLDEQYGFRDGLYFLSPNRRRRFSICVCTG